MTYQDLNLHDAVWYEKNPPDWIIAWVKKIDHIRKVILFKDTFYNEWEENFADIPQVIKQVIQL